MEKTLTIAGKEFPVSAVVVTKHFGNVPVLNVRQKKDVKRKGEQA